ncbi:MAG: double-strand break repair protein AddB [Pseudomonadota bacterium]
MAEARQPSIYTILPHRGFADALATGLVARYRNRADGLAALTLLLPNQRARRAMLDAFVRQSEGGLLLPKMVVIGDSELAESVGPGLDPLGQADILAEIDPLHRQFVLASSIRAYQTTRKQPLSLAESFRLAREFATMLDQLAVEEQDHGGLDTLVTEHQDALAKHWQVTLDLVHHVARQWQDYCAGQDRLDAARRRNLLFGYAAKTIADHPGGDLIAAGITTPAPAVARLLRAIAFADGGSVILPGLDLNLDEDVWQGLMPRLSRDDDPVAADDNDDRAGHQINHPQYHLRLLLDRMSVRRDEVRNWHRSGPGAAPPATSRTISNVFLPARHSGRWRALESAERRLPNVRLIECDTLGEEAQMVALLVREALETPEKRVAVVTPDRTLARRVARHLARWNITADDSAGRPLGETPPGSLLLSIVEALASRFSPVALLDMLKHPLVTGDRLRGEWLSQVRALDLALRGPRTGLGPAAITRQITRHFADRKQSDSEAAQSVQGFWDEVQADYLAPLGEGASLTEKPLADWLAAVRDCADRLTAGAIWQGQAGRALADSLSALEGEAQAAGLIAPADELPVMLRGFFADIAIRPGYGQHPRVAIFGLLEARLQRADLMICAGLNTGKWPQQPDPDPFIPPMLRRKLGMPTVEYSNGLSAHDLAAALGAPECVLTRAARDAEGITIASPFLRRLQAMLGNRLQSDRASLMLARQLDRQLPPQRIATPAPAPSADRRQVTLAATDLDRLRGAPFAFYAGKILRLRSIDSPDAPPSAAWRGTAVHAILEDWIKQDGSDPALLAIRLDRFWQEQVDFPILRAVWRPRIDAAMRWIAEETERLRSDGREILAAEVTGRIDYHGVTLKGTADRIDRSSDGGLIIIDYKIGQPPTARQLETGYAMQLGVLSLIAECDGFESMKGTVETVEYWSLARDSKVGTFGYRKQPLRVGSARSGLQPEEFLPTMVVFLDDALDRWIFGNEPFTAEPDPDYPGYNDYDDLSRLEEWYGRARDMAPGGDG